MGATLEPIPPASYHFLTPFYDLGCVMLGLGRRFRQRTLHQLDLRPGLRVLDIGCGTGVLSCLLKQQHPEVEVVGVDPTADALRIARRRAEAAGVHVTWVEATGTRTGLADAGFDRVVSTLMMHHVPIDQKGAVLAECARVLKPGGFLTIADFSAAEVWYDKLALRFFARHEHVRGQLDGRLQALLRAANFANVSVVDRWHWGIEFIHGEK